MKTHLSETAYIFIRTDKETKREFLRAVAKVCLSQNTLGELLIKKGAKRINTKIWNAES